MGLKLVILPYRFRPAIPPLLHRKWLAVILATATPLVLRALLIPWMPVPEPRVHDEFSYLLAADTFAHARLANPQHPFWVHFESMHILARPVYASAFPIAQAAALAAGKVVFGHAWAGVWLTTGLMCGAICWMLLGWVPARWALFGTLLVILRIGVSSYWMNSYWGGSVAALAGALVLGALPRMNRPRPWRYAIVMGIGLAILANSRPFEGAIFGLIVAVPLFTRVAIRRVILPLAGVLALTGAFMAYYFMRVSGKPWLAPYVSYRSTMTTAPHFVFQSPRPAPLYNNAEMRNFYLYDEMHSYRTARGSPFSDLVEKTAVYWRFFLGPILTIPLLTLPLLWRSQKTRRLLFMLAAFSLALLPQVWHNPHYAAPATGLVILIVIEGTRRLQLWRWRNQRAGLYIVRALPIACAVILTMQVSVKTSEVVQATWRWPAPGGVKRAAILKQLEHSGAQNLVFVRYNTAKHDTGDEWVYNGADLDRSQVIWARELDPASNRKLIGYFANRRVWLVEPDLPTPRLTPYDQVPIRPMPFVQLGAPGIDALRSPEEVKRKIAVQAQRHGNTNFTCYQWNYFFTEATGVAGPTCWSNNPGQPISLDDWFAWLKRQR